MERGPLLKTVTSLTFPLILVIALYLLLSGHNRAGGGFIAGVLVSGAIALQYLAHGFHQVPTFLRLPYRLILGLGLLLSVVVGFAPILWGFPFLTSFHGSVNVPVLGSKMEFSLAQAFDLGIFMLVVGGLMTAILALREE